MNYESSAGAIVYYINSKTKKISYLILHYNDNHWDFPKGKIESGETKRQAALREIKEETGLDVVLNTDFEQSLSYFFKNKEGNLISKDVTFYVAQAPTQEVTLSPEHIYFNWHEFNDALKKLTFNNARQLLQMAHQFIESLHQDVAQSEQ